MPGALPLAGALTGTFIWQWVHLIAGGGEGGKVKDYKH
jgi:hypothetical protein